MLAYADFKISVGHIFHYFFYWLASIGFVTDFIFISCHIPFMTTSSDDILIIDTPQSTFVVAAQLKPHQKLRSRVT